MMILLCFQFFAQMLRVVVSVIPILKDHTDFQCNVQFSQVICNYVSVNSVIDGFKP